jgi:putative inorganic carbon (HCO3(-)) transporter
MFFGGVITMGGGESFKSATLYVVLIIGYILVVNLINTEEWLEKCISVIAIPSAIIAAYGVLGYTTVNMPAKWIDSSMFGEIASRATSTFENPNMLATYLVITAPFIWRYLKKDGVSIKGKIIAAIGSIISIACIVLTWSRGGWIGVVVAAIFFCLINYRYALQYLVAIGLLSPVWIAFLPSNIFGRLTSIGNLADSSTYYRLFTWKGSLKMLLEYFPGGIGVGESAFAQVYPFYSYVGVETTVHSHNLFLEIAIELGVVGLAIFLIILFMGLQRGFGCIKQNSKNRTTVCTVSAGIAGLFGAFAHGMVDHIWYNYRVFFVFWIVLAFVCACSNVYSNHEKNAKSYSDEDVGKASLDIIFGRE